MLTSFNPFEYVHYFHNSASWVTREKLFIQWLLKLYRDMMQMNRTIYLLLDSCSAPACC